MFGLESSVLSDRPRKKAVKALFSNHRGVCTPEARSRRLLRDWLSPAQQAQFACEGYIEVVGGHTGNKYRVYAGTSLNVFQLDDEGRPYRGLCFLPLGELPSGDVMLAQKLALENFETTVLGVAREFAARRGFMRPRPHPTWLGHGY